VVLQEGKHGLFLGAADLQEGKHGLFLGAACCRRVNTGCFWVLHVAGG